jgi:hypothetical protein
MVEYTPPPADLSHLNPIQRYMQKGQLEGTDWVYLFLFVAAYFAARPTIEKVIKYWMTGGDLKEGEQAQADYVRSKAKVGSNSIRGKQDPTMTSIPEASEDTTTGSSVNPDGNVTNRKAKDATKELLDWDDEPAREPTEGDKGDVVAWMNRWSNQE